MKGETTSKEIRIISFYDIIIMTIYIIYTKYT